MRHVYQLLYMRPEQSCMKKWNPQAIYRHPQQWNWRRKMSIMKGCRIVFGIFLPQVLCFFCFLSWHHLPCICNSLELEPFISHGVCYILAWSLRILHGICYVWPCSPSILHCMSHFGISTSHLHGICYVLALQRFTWVSWGFFGLSFRVSFKVSFTVSLRVLFRASFGVLFRVSFKISLGFHLRFHLGFRLVFLYGFI